MKLSASIIIIYAALLVFARSCSAPKGNTVYSHVCEAALTWLDCDCLWMPSMECSVECIDLSRRSFVCSVKSRASGKRAQISLNDGRSDGSGDQHAFIVSRKKHGTERGIFGLVALFTTHLMCHSGVILPKGSFKVQS
jgi:hypothetical protein